jgi:hypothetical protein
MARMMNLRSARTRVLVVLAGIAVGASVALLARPGDTAVEPTPADHAATVTVAVEIVVPQAEVGWPLISDTDAGRRRPPDDVRDCRTFTSWALGQGARLSLNPVHRLTLTSTGPVHIVVSSMRVRPRPLPASTATAKPVRLACRTDPKSAWSDEPVRTDVEEPVETTDDTAATPESYVLDYVFDLDAGGGATLTFPVEPQRGSIYEYHVEVDLLVNGVRQVLTATSPYPLIYSTDPGGIGYVPADYIWTLNPSLDLVVCPEAYEPIPAGRC